MTSHAAEIPSLASIEALPDETALTRALTLPPGQILPALKQVVQQFNDGLKQLYFDGADVETIVHGRAQIIDRFMVKVYQHIFAEITQKVSLIAVGGYGRGELHPYSDIDLMLLLDSNETDSTRDAIEKFLMLLWDSRLEIGHSVRTLDECVRESQKDITVATNIMEARLLCGDHDLFQQMKNLTGPDKIWDAQSFFEAKLEEQILRNGKFNDTAYSLEPNIKESAGGLRDIQMIGWVAKRHFGAECLQELVDHDFLRQYELDALLKGQHLLWRIRCSLHYLTNKREDRMLFDYQRDLAIEFGYQDDPTGKEGNLAIEQFMQQYYRTVMELERLNEMLLQLFREAIVYKDQPGELVKINEQFQVQHGYIEVTHPGVFQENPTALLEIFLLLQTHAEIQGVRAETIRLIRENRDLINSEFRNSSKAKSIFITIMRQARGITHELRRMNRYGILARYIPAFDQIVGRMQYDLFHAFTVDQHTLFVVRNLRRFSVPEFCHEFPLASGVFHHLKKPELLYLAGLFHDIAKGRGGDHSVVGADDAKQFCLDHGLSDDDARLVSWLVRNHLIMSMTAQRKDINDPDIIADFANNVKNIAHLDYLYLLTIADIRGTNPRQWSSWKDKLLIELYNKTAQLLHRGIDQAADKQETLRRHQTDALRTLDLLGISAQRTHALWKHFTNEYFLRHTASEIVWHTQQISEHDYNKAPLIKCKTNVYSGSIEVLVYSNNSENLFAQVVSVISQLNLSVADAQIMLSRNGYLLETFRIIFSQESEAHLDHYALELELKIEHRLNNPSLPVDNNQWNKPRHHQHFTVPTAIDFENDDDWPTTRMNISTTDRQGLLAVIANVFIDCDIRIHNAKVSTAGEKAMDYFDITSKITDARLTTDDQEKLKHALLQQL
jgi:[protein-PII] uridylyltransferase